MSTKRNPLNVVYKLNHSNLKAVNSTKYLGITITSDLNWKEHIEGIVGKATKGRVSLAEYFEGAIELLKRLPTLRLSVLYWSIAAQCGILIR